MQTMTAPATLRTRETLAVGDSGIYTKLISEADVFAFAGISGDFNPLHIDAEFAQRSQFKQRIAHGILTAGIISTVLGAEIPGVGTIFVELQVRFLKPVYFGDTMTARATVTEIVNPKRIRLLVACVNQEGKDVAIGNALVVPPRETRIIL